MSNAIRWPRRRIRFLDALSVYGTEIATQIPPKTLAVAGFVVGIIGSITLKTRMEGPKIASFYSRVNICGSMGSHPEGPSRSDGISLMLSRLRRFDSRHSRF
jgi:hypothetical protein